MTQATASKPRHVPLRTCIGCNSEKPKMELIRIVRTPEGNLAVDGPKGKLKGRGAYVCPQVECMEKVIKRKALPHTFKQAFPPEQLEVVKQQFVERLLTPSI